MNNRSISVFLLLLLCLPFAAFSQADSKETLNIHTPPAKYDSIIASWKANSLSENAEQFLEDEYIILDTSRYLEAVSTVSDTICRARLRTIPSPIHLPYNDIVRKHIVAYTTTHKSITRRMLTYGKYYFPMIEQELDKNGLPLELKIVPVIESALTPTAVSRRGAVGLWQFMLQTGRQYGLEVNSMVDNRRDPILSTEAACKYIKDLYDIYHDWTLVLASYNYGPGNVNRAIQRAGGNAKTFWDIYPYLPRETRDYIPAFIALTYLYYYHWDYGVVAYESPLPLATDTVMVNARLNLNIVSDSTGIPIELIRLMNPQYKTDEIPAMTKSYPLVLPQEEISHYIACEQGLIAASSAKTPASNIQEVSVPDPIVHRVKKGETLGGIAKKYHVSVKQLMQWNGLRNSMIRIGQSLKIVR